MRFATVEHCGVPCCGVVTQDTWHPMLGGVTLLDLLQQGTAALAEAGERARDTVAPIPLRGLRLLPPLDPPTVRDFVAFEEHVEGVRLVLDGTSGVPAEWYEAPAFYFTNPHALIGAHDDVAIPPGCRVLDFELEVAAVIGREGNNLTPEQARDHIAGYAIFNDWSARDVQGREMKVGLGPAKGKDFASTLGPWLVTADELEPCRDADGFLDLLMTVEVNGREVGRDRLSNMAWPFEELVAYAARGTRVRPGDVLGSGTCGNGGCLAELWGRRGRRDPPPLRAGDEVTMSVAGIGEISNRVVTGAPAMPVTPARPHPRKRHHASQGECNEALA